ncbi:flavodoxin family protein [Anaerosacchariphilus polymeriproducens]|uniref:flavodoxin family protein n=1 Tax=Anaerosacchariphilus polymeriproducens TaxID=1812858 RepID=UPI001F36DB5D|nr:hypothetical protein [Anaerosacchariphilus polymeriproducens]
MLRFRIYKKHKIPDLSLYDNILIGGPVWGQSISNPIRRFLQDANLTGKKVSAFWTFYDHDEYYDRDMDKVVAEKGASYIHGLAMPRSLVRNTDKLKIEIDAWLKKMM